MIQKIKAWAKRTSQIGSVIDGVSEMCVGVIGLVIVEAFVADTVLTGTDAASNIAKVALPLALVAMIVFGAFRYIKAKK